MIDDDSDEFDEAPEELTLPRQQQQREFLNIVRNESPAAAQLSDMLRIVHKPATVFAALALVFILPSARFGIAIFGLYSFMYSGWFGSTAYLNKMLAVRYREQIPKVPELSQTAAQACRMAAGAAVFMAILPFLALGLSSLYR